MLKVKKCAILRDNFMKLEFAACHCKILQNRLKIVLQLSFTSM